MIPVNTKTLNTQNWQHARDTIGGVVTEIEDIEQCIETICTCEKGKVIHNPELGLAMNEFIDKPVNVSLPAIRRMIKSELQIQEPRIKIDTVTINADDNGFMTIKTTYVFENILRTKEVQTQWQMN